jgi:Helix-turn-helix domain
MKATPLTTEQAAPLIGVSPLTLISWRHFGKGPPYLKVGRRALYYPSDIEAWLDSQVVVPVPKKSGAGV